MNVAELRAELISEINQADEGLLFEIQQVIDQHATNEIPEAVFTRIKIAQQQAIDGKGVPHEEAIKRLNLWKEK
jgi:hypothetical protein